MREGRGDARRRAELLSALPGADAWSGLPADERARRTAVLRDIRKRIERDGPRRPCADSGRGRLFIPFAALKGFEELIEGEARDAGRQ
ncbi:MAG TPA: hypothetical protein IAD14_04800 [Candidatus Coprousia avicola]|nr:hypothetical protein [Candidatus Coprousia avicola]